MQGLDCPLSLWISNLGSDSCLICSFRVSSVPDSPACPGSLCLISSFVHLLNCILSHLLRFCFPKSDAALNWLFFNKQTNTVENGTLLVTLELYEIAILLTLTLSFSLAQAQAFSSCLIRGLTNQLPTRFSDCHCRQHLLSFHWNSFIRCNSSFYFISASYPGIVDHLFVWWIWATISGTLKAITDIAIGIQRILFITRLVLANSRL